MSAHTAGPWIGVGPLPVAGGGRAFAVQAAGGFTVAMVGANDDDLTLARADVLLIEAAPDLLAVARRWLRIMGAAGADKCGCNSSESYVCCRCEVVAAIALAESPRAKRPNRNGCAVHVPASGYQNGCPYEIEKPHGCKS